MACVTIAGERGRCGEDAAVEVKMITALSEEDEP
jgi:hypothetical protein